MGLESILVGAVDTGIKVFGGITSLISPWGKYLKLGYDKIKQYAQPVYEYITDLVKKVLDLEPVKKYIYDSSTKKFKMQWLDQIVKKTLQVYKDIKSKYLSGMGEGIKRYAGKLYDKLKSLAKINPGLPAPRYNNPMYLFFHNIYYNYVYPMFNFMGDLYNKIKKIYKGSKLEDKLMPWKNKAAETVRKFDWEELFKMGLEKAKLFEPKLSPV